MFPEPVRDGVGNLFSLGKSGNIQPLIAVQCYILFLFDKVFLDLMLFFIVAVGEDIMINLVFHGLFHIRDIILFLLLLNKSINSWNK